MKILLYGLALLGSITENLYCSSIYNYSLRPDFFSAIRHFKNPFIKDASSQETYQPSAPHVSKAPSIEPISYAVLGPQAYSLNKLAAQALIAKNKLKYPLLLEAPFERAAIEEAPQEQLVQPRTPNTSQATLPSRQNELLSPLVPELQSLSPEGVRARAITESIIDGGTVYHHIMAGTQGFNKKLTEDQIRQLIWFIYAETIRQNQIPSQLLNAIEVKERNTFKPLKGIFSELKNNPVSLNSNLEIKPAPLNQDPLTIEPGNNLKISWRSPLETQRQQLQEDLHSSIKNDTELFQQFNPRFSTSYWIMQTSKALPLQDLLTLSEEIRAAKPDLSQALLNMYNAIGIPQMDAEFFYWPAYYYAKINQGENQESLKSAIELLTKIQMQFSGQKKESSALSQKKQAKELYDLAQTIKDPKAKECFSIIARTMAISGRPLLPEELDHVTYKNIYFTAYIKKVFPEFIASLIKSIESSSTKNTPSTPKHALTQEQVLLYYTLVHPRTGFLGRYCLKFFIDDAWFKGQSNQAIHTLNNRLNQTTESQDVTNYLKMVEKEQNIFFTRITKKAKKLGFKEEIKQIAYLPTMANERALIQKNFNAAIVKFSFNQRNMSDQQRKILSDCTKNNLFKDKATTKDLAALIEEETAVLTEKTIQEIEKEMLPLMTSYRNMRIITPPEAPTAFFTSTDLTKNFQGDIIELLKSPKIQRIINLKTEPSSHFIQTLTKCLAEAQSIR